MKHLIFCLPILLFSACSTKAPEASKAEEKQGPSYTKVDPQTAGAVHGKVTFTGKAAPMKSVDLTEDPECAKLHKKPLLNDSLIVDPKSKAVANVFVHIKQGLEGKTFEPPSQPVAISQKGCWFSPRVFGIQVGQTLRVTNDDPVTHNIHPLAQVNREWNQSQDAGSEALTRKFTKPEVMVKVKCNIHPWMRGWIGVVDGPYFSVTGVDGGFEIGNLPPGNYVVEAWHEELGAKQMNVTIAPSAKPELNIAF